MWINTPPLSTAHSIFRLKTQKMELEQLWKNTQEELKVVMASAVYQTFVASTQLLSYQNQKITIGCPNSYLVSINQKRYLDLFKSAFDNQTKANNKIEFILQPTLSQPTKTTSATPDPPLLNFSTTSTFQSNLHPKYTFDQLVVGNSNNFAYAAAQGVVQNPGLTYNPFFIWGGVGVGKTHLMQAVGHQILKNNPNFKVRYFPAEQFGNDLISAIKSKSMNQFKDKYRSLDCMLVDDIQFIAGKEYIQQEFFHTFNTLHMSGKQVILVSDRKPSDIDHLEDRLVSRFMGGLTVDIQLPDYEMRLAIINQKAEEKGIKISSDAATLIAQNVDSNIRDIEGNLQQISLTAIANRVGEITADFAAQFFNSSTATTQKTSISSTATPRHLISACAKYFDIKTGDLLGKSRQKDLVTARHITAYLLLNQLNLPLEEVGRLLGGRDHTSIMHARDKIHTSLSTNPQLQKHINTITASL